MQDNKNQISNTILEYYQNHQFNTRRNRRNTKR